MKLYPIIYEGAKTASEAVGKNIGIISSKDFASTPSKYNRILLVDVDRVANYMKRWPIDNIASNRANIDKQLAGRAVVGLIEYSQQDDDLFDVNISAGVASFGPLAYQIAMYETGGWLMSDESLKPASKKVWQKMYELSNQGVYERKWLGHWGEGPLKDHLYIQPETVDLRDYIKGLDFGGFKIEDEQRFISWCQEHDLNPQTYGWLWAYKTNQPDSKVSEMYEKGRQLVKDIANMYPVYSQEDVINMFRTVGRRFFGRLYGSAASYTE